MKIDEIIFNVKHKTLSLKLVVHVDMDMPEKLKSATEIFSLLSSACLITYLHHRGRMGLNCLGVNTDFIYTLATSENRPAFTDYNNLFTPWSTAESPLFGSHHMVELLYKDFCIGIDVAAEQYRQDGTIAEITLAKSHDELNELLLKRHKLTKSWLVNEIKKDTQMVDLLRKSNIKPLLIEEQQEKLNEKVEPLIEVYTSGCNCTIL
jgi:hypothetical protein